MVVFKRDYIDIGALCKPVDSKLNVFNSCQSSLKTDESAPYAKVNLRSSGCGRVCTKRETGDIQSSVHSADRHFLLTCFIPDIDNEEDTWINGF